MVDESSGSTGRDRQVNEIITAYLEAVDTGQSPVRMVFWLLFLNARRIWRRRKQPLEPQADAAAG